MAKHSPLFLNYAQQQQDFSGAFPAPQGQAFEGAAPQGVSLAALPITQPQGAPAFMPGNASVQEPDPLQEVAQNPFFQFYNMYKGSSKEKQKVAIARLAQDVKNPLEMGLPYDEAVFGEVAKDPNGQNKADPSAWKRFIDFVDGNPQFLLDLGAQLLAPRQQGTSQLGAIASALSGATARLAQRRAAAEKGKLEGRVAEAGIEKTLAEASESPSRIAKNLADANRALKGDLNKQAAQVQLKNSIMNDLWSVGGGTKYKTRAEAGIDAIAIMNGSADIDLKAYYDYAKENAFIAGAGEAIEGAKQMRAGAPLSPLEQVKADRNRIKAERAAAKAPKVPGLKPIQQQQLDYAKKFDFDREKIADDLATQPQFARASREQLLALADKGLARIQGFQEGKVSGKPKKVLSLREQARELSKLPGDEVPANETPRQKAARQRQQRALRKEAKEAYTRFKRGEQLSVTELKLALRVATTDNRRRQIIREIKRRGK